MCVDYLIIGQGIAGSMLAWFLSKAGKNILIIDEFNPHSASQIASGIINPVTGKRLVKSWRIDELLPFAEKTYREIEKEFGIKILSEKTICRIFSNQEDFHFFRQKKELDELPENIKPLKKIPECFPDAALGGIEINGVFQLDYPVLLSAIRNHFLEKKLLREEKFQHEKIQLVKGKVIYDNIEAGKIIFCEGSNASGNPYLKWLPFNLAKGEALLVKMNGFPQDNIWHKGIFISPMGNNLFRIGSTYDWDFSDDKPSEQGKEELVSRLKKAVSLPFELTGHFAAIRPTVADRRPLIGLHPQFPGLATFNGLGTKGASLAPFFANQFSEFLLKGNPLDEEVNVRRVFNRA